MSYAAIAGIVASTLAIAKTIGVVESAPIERGPLDEYNIGPEMEERFADIQPRNEPLPSAPKPTLLDRLYSGAGQVAQGVAEGAKESTVRQLPLSGVLYDYNAKGLHLTTGGRVVLGIAAAYAISRMIR